MTVARNDAKLDWIQALRGIAIILVMLCHARNYFQNTPLWPTMDMMLLPGAMGVDLFFIISGFIMVYTTTDSDATVGYTVAFSIKRIARVWPAYAVATLLYALVTGNGLAYFHDRAHWQGFLGSLLLIPSNNTPAPFFDFVLPVAWTLAFEMYFYAVFAVSMLFGRLRWAVLLGWMMLTAFVIPLVWGNTDLNVRAQYGYSLGVMNLMTDTIILDFVAGVIIAKLYLMPRLVISSRALCHHLVGGSIVFALWCNYTSMETFHGPLGWGWPLGLMVLCLSLASKTVDLVPPKLLVWFGGISYSLYLLHMAAQFWISRWLDQHGVAGDPWGRVVISSLLAIMISTLSHTYIEVRLGGMVRTVLTKWASHLFKHSTKGAPAADVPRDLNATAVRD